MKKILAFLSALCVLTAPVSTISSNFTSYSAEETETAETDEIWGETEDFTYKIVDGEIEVVYCLNDAADVVIPAEIDGIPVTKISGNAFNGRKTLHQ